MSEWNLEEYLYEQVNRIEELKKKGLSDRQILDLNEFSDTALMRCNMSASYLVPGEDAKEMTCDEWLTHTSFDGKWEYDGTPFNSLYVRDRVLVGLLYSCGWKHLLEILPQESKNELIELLGEEGS